METGVKRARDDEEETLESDEDDSDFATGLPSPTDTEPIEEWLLPRARCLPRAPATLRGSHYQQACDDFVDDRSCLSQTESEYFPCFRPHMIALIDRKSVV